MTKVRMKLPTRVVIKLSCEHEVIYATPIPGEGELVWCRKCCAYAVRVLD